MRAEVPVVTSRLPAPVIAARMDHMPVRTVQNWQRGHTLPSAFHWEALKEIFPELEAKSREWQAQSLGVDPADETRLLSELHRMISTRLAANPRIEGGKTGGGK